MLILPMRFRPLGHSAWILIPVSLSVEAPIEVILLRVLFTAKVLTNLRWQGRGGAAAAAAAEWQVTP